MPGNVPATSRMPAAANNGCARPICADASTYRVGQCSQTQRTIADASPSERNCGWTMTRLIVRTCALAKRIFSPYRSPRNPNATSRPPLTAVGHDSTPTATTRRSDATDAPAGTYRTTQMAAQVRG